MEHSDLLLSHEQSEHVRSSNVSISSVTDGTAVGETHHFGGDVGVRQVSVLTHDWQVAVDFDGQRVACQHHDPADTHISSQLADGTASLLTREATDWAFKVES